MGAAMNEPEQVVIYADGACKGNPGPGGWGALLTWNGHERELFGGEPATTNNRMELLAVIRALEALSRSTQVAVYTDSQYVHKGITEWLSAWKRRGWLTADKSRSRMPICGSNWRRRRRDIRCAGTGSRAMPVMPAMSVPMHWRIVVSLAVVSTAAPAHALEVA